MSDSAILFCHTSISLCHLCGAREWAEGRDRDPACPHYLVAFPCPVCTRPRKFRVTWWGDSPIASVALSCDFCDSRQGPLPGTVAWARWILMRSTIPDMRDPLATGGPLVVDDKGRDLVMDDPRRDLVRVRLLLAQLFDLNLDARGDLAGRCHRVGDAFGWLIAAMVERGCAENPEAALAASLAPAITTLRAMVQAKGLVPVGLPFDAIAEPRRAIAAEPPDPPARPTRLAANERRENLKALIESISAIHAWGITKGEIIRRTGYAKSNVYRDLTHPTLKTVWAQYQRDSQGKRPVSMDELGDVGAFSHAFPLEE